MKISDYIFKSGPAKWIILYIVIMTFIAFLFASFRPPSITDNIYNPSDSTFSEKKEKNIKKTSLIESNKNQNKKKLIINKTKIKSDSAVVPDDLIKKYLEKYKATIFNEYHYPYTIDYQENLINKNTIFYIVVDDIFEENGKIYLKAAKSYLGLNVYLKLQCDKNLAKKLKSIQYYTYVVARISRINNIYFNTKAVKRNNDITDVDINLSSNNINLMIVGKCLDTFEK